MNNEQNQSVTPQMAGHGGLQYTPQETQATEQSKVNYVIRPSEHTIHQLAKMARRIPRLISKFRAKLAKKNLTVNQVREYMSRLVQAEGTQRMLQNELDIRKVTAPAKVIDPAVLRREYGHDNSIFRTHPGYKPGEESRIFQHAKTTVFTSAEIRRFGIPASNLSL